MEISMTDLRGGSKVYTCPKEGCDRAFTKQAWFRRHVQECCYGCICGKYFESKIVLLLHAAEAHSDLVDMYSLMGEAENDSPLRVSPRPPSSSSSIGSSSPDSSTRRPDLRFPMPPYPHPQPYLGPVGMPMHVLPPFGMGPPQTLPRWFPGGLHLHHHHS